MKLKAEDGYWSLKSSGLREWIGSSTFLQKYGRGLWLFVVIFWLILTGYVLFICGFPWGLSNIVALISFFGIAIGSLLAVYIPLYRLIYGSFREHPETMVDLSRAEFHTLGTCQNIGKRILDMVGDLNVADHYIFLLNFHNLFYHEEHKLENPDQNTLNVIGKAVRILPEESGGTTWTKNPLQAAAGGWKAGKEVADKQTVSYITDKLGGLPEPAETRAIITKEYLPDLLREFPRDVAMYIAVVVGTASNYTAVFPFDPDVVTEEEAIAVASNPTRENVVNYCSKFTGLAVEEPVTRRKGLMED